MGDLLGQKPVVSVFIILVAVDHAVLVFILILMFCSSSTLRVVDEASI